MKRTLLTTLALAGMTVSAFSQGVIYFDGSANNNPSPIATSEGQVFIEGLHDTTQDIDAALMMYNGTSFVPVVTLLLSLGSNYTTTTAFGTQQGATGDVTDFQGRLIDVSGNDYVSTLAVGATATFEVQGWLGNYSSYAAAKAGGAFLLAQTAPFTEVLTSTTGAANNIGNMPALYLIDPEPSMFALSSLGAAALMLNRRKKSSVSSKSNP